MWPCLATPLWSAPRAATNGDYVFELAVTRSGTTPVVKIVLRIHGERLHPADVVLRSAQVTPAAAPNATVALRACGCRHARPDQPDLRLGSEVRSDRAISSANVARTHHLCPPAGTYEFAFKAVSGAQEKLIRPWSL